METVKVRLTTVVITILVVSNLVFAALLVREKAYSGLQELALTKTYYQITNSIEHINTLKSNVATVKLWNLVAIENKEVLDETRTNYIERTDGQLLHQCGRQLRRLRRGFTVLEEDIRRRSHELAYEKERLRDSCQDGKVAMDNQLPTQHHN